MDLAELGKQFQKSTINIDVMGAGLFRSCLTNKNGKIARSVTLSRGMVKRPQVDGVSGEIIEHTLLPVIGEGFTGKVDIKINLDGFTGKDDRIYAAIA